MVPPGVAIASSRISGNAGASPFQGAFIRSNTARASAKGKPW